MHPPRRDEIRQGKRNTPISEEIRILSDLAPLLAHAKMKCIQCKTPPMEEEVKPQSSTTSTKRRRRCQQCEGRLGVVAYYQLVTEVDGGVLVAGLLPLGAAAIDADPPEPGPPLRAAAAAANPSPAARQRRHVRRRPRGCLLGRRGPVRRRWRRGHDDRGWDRRWRLQCNGNRRCGGHGDATRSCSGDRARAASGRCTYGWGSGGWVGERWDGLGEEPREE